MTKILFIAAGLLASGLIGWFSYWSLFVAPYRAYVYTIDASGTRTIAETNRLDLGIDEPDDVQIDGPAHIGSVLPGDILIAIDGLVPTISDFDINADLATQSNVTRYELIRDGTSFAAEFSKRPGTMGSSVLRWFPPISALLMLSLGFIALTSERQPSSVIRVFFTFAVGFGVWLAADRSLKYGAPLSFFVSAAIGPLLAPLYLDSALRLSGLRDNRTGKAMLVLAYVFHGLIALWGVATTLWLAFDPSAILSLVMFYDIGLPLGGLAIFYCPLIMIAAGIRNQIRRRTLLSVGLAALLAGLPSLLLDIGPQLLGTSPGYRDVPMTLYVLIPLLVGFATFRSRHLGLEVLYSRFGMGLVVAFVLISLFALVDILAGSSLRQASLIALAAALIAIAILTIAIARLQPILDYIIFGQAERLNDFLAELSGEIQHLNDYSDIARIIVAPIGSRLRIETSALIAAQGDGQGDLISVTPKTQVVSLEVANAIPASPAMRQSDPDHPIWKLAPWAGIALPAWDGSRWTGLLLLSIPANIDTLNYKAVQFVLGLGNLVQLSFDKVRLQHIQEDAFLREIGEITRKNLDIGNDIHDGPIASMQEILLSLDDLGRSSPRVSVEHVVEQVQVTLRQLRSVVADLRPVAESQSVSMIITSIEREFGILNPGIEFHSRVDLPDDVSLSAQGLNSLYRVLRGALRNVTQHAQATRVAILAKRIGGSIGVEVIDNGIGLTDREISNRTEWLVRQHFGLQFLHDYARIAGGQLKVFPADGRGTIVQILLPLDNFEARSLPGSTLRLSSPPVIE